MEQSKLSSLFELYIKTPNNDKNFTNVPVKKDTDKVEGNGEDVFAASNVKPVNRKSPVDLGNTAGQDEAGADALDNHKEIKDIPTAMRTVFSKSVKEDLDIKKVKKGEIDLKDPANDEVDALKKDSPEKKKEILDKVEKDIKEEVEERHAKMTANQLHSRATELTNTMEKHHTSSPEHAAARSEMKSVNKALAKHYKWEEAGQIDESLDSKFAHDTIKNVHEHLGTKSPWTSERKDMSSPRGQVQTTFASKHTKTVHEHLKSSGWKEVDSGGSPGKKLYKQNHVAIVQTNSLSIHPNPPKGHVSHVSEGTVDEAAYSAKAGSEGKDLGKPGKNFGKIAAKAGKEYGSKKAGEKVAGAILAKIRAKHEEAPAPEGQQIDELSKATLGSYVKKSLFDVTDTALNMSSTPRGDDRKKAWQKIHKREKGVKTAVNKLTKESVIDSVFVNFIDKNTTEGPTLDEQLAANIGPLNEQTVDLIVEFFSIMDDDNKATIVELTETKEGIDELLDFIISQTK